MLVPASHVADVTQKLVGSVWERCPVTCSIGVAASGLSTVHDWVASADRAMYTAKAHGRDPVAGHPVATDPVALDTVRVALSAGG